MPSYPSSSLAPSYRRRPRRRRRRALRTTIAALALLAAAVVGGLVAVAYLWPPLQAAADPAALARIRTAPIGDRLVRLAVYDEQGRRVPVSLRDGRLWPRGTVAPGERLTVDATVRRAGWIGWLVGRSEHVSLTETTPEAHLASTTLTPAAGDLVRLEFDAPVATVALSGQYVPAPHVTLAHPRMSVPTWIRAAGAHRAGTIFVAVAPRAWESLSAPTRVSWFPAASRVEALVKPAPGARLRPTDRLEITFSDPVTKVLGDSFPTLHPATPGHWRSVDETTISFEPSGLGFPLGAHVHVAFPRSVDVVTGARTRTVETLTWQTPDPSTLRLQQLLAQEGYLPLAWQPSGPDVPRTAAAQTLAAVAAPSGRFAWQFANAPSPLTSLWSPGHWTTMMQGAVMAFESDHALDVDGLAGPKVWHALLADALAGRHSPRGYSYVLVHRAVPQTLELWHNGAVVLTARVNTGVPAAPTPLGTHPVFEHIESGTMSGTNPDGSHYHDPGIRWISYFNGGEAIHGFNRASYGFPQSVGCVEAPIATAAQIWPYTPIGTLVSITD